MKSTLTTIALIVALILVLHSLESGLPDVGGTSRGLQLFSQIAGQELKSATK